ncbi:MAG: hypothetical protein KGD65_04235 [Candidatus Lokiarchaeota archaeon]|nr:hypothetical protein [Candidatus Lokiarchaeota archaeon]
MRKTKLLSVLIFSALIFGVIGGAVGYQEYLYRWEDNGEGGTHSGCHHDDSVESVNGTLVLTVNETGNLSPGQAFTLEIDVLNFTEATIDPYVRSGKGRVSVGLPGYKGDNAKFTLALNHQTLNRGESLDEWGSYDPSNTNNVFELFAPMEAGTFELWAVVMAAMNQTDMESANITYVEDFVSITVVAPSGAAAQPSIPGGLLTIIISSTVAISTILVIRMRKRLRN